MSEQRKHVVKLVEEILFHKGEQERREAELDTILGARPKKTAKSSAKSADTEADTRTQIVEYMEGRRDRSITATDIKKDLDITTSSFGYHMKAMLAEKKVKRMKRGHYQLRGKR